MTSTVAALFGLLLAFPVDAFMETPKFSQLLLLYPGYPQHGGHFSHNRLMRMIGSADANGTSPTGDVARNHQDVTRHSTAAVRLSYTLNRYGGRHAIGPDPIYLSHLGRDSFDGRDGNQYIHRNTAFGPFLAARYGNPVVAWAPGRAPSSAAAAATTTAKAVGGRLMAAFAGRQGIVRVVSYRGRHEDGHVALWNCDRFHQSRDWTTEEWVISVEFWESADSYCAPPPSSDVGRPMSAPHRQPIDDRREKLVLRHNFASPNYLHDGTEDRRRHHSSNARHRDTEKIWLQ